MEILIHLLNAVSFLAMFVAIFMAVYAHRECIRRRKRDRRIIEQAKAEGVWDNPLCLGGRALELKAWQDFKIKREPGETDIHLRFRYRLEQSMKHD